MNNLNIFDPEVFELTLLKTIPIDELALLWVSTMIYYTEIVPRRFSTEPSLAQTIERDQFQFQAIAHQLEMLCWTRPVDSWARYVWRQNFVLYVSQIIRRSQLFFQHLGALPHFN
ncbi:MAG TPA: hypothetical protein DDW50_02515 [Firmicutes bacterium]|jgi:hypothetical protein|nr:hypothetical protein [Bacillota bacterium]